MTVVPSELGLTNALSPLSPLYYLTRECSSSSSLSPTQQEMERANANNNRYSNGFYSNANNEEISFSGRKRKMVSVRQRHCVCDPNHHQIPERLQSLVSGHEHLGDPEVMRKWVDSFLPKPEPPRFFRPLCKRLSRQQLRLREEQAACARQYTARMDEVRARIAMSVSEVRAEQKTMLRELRQQRKRTGEQKKREESDGREPKKREESDGREAKRRAESDGREAKRRAESDGGEKRDGTEGGEQRNSNGFTCNQVRTKELEKDKRQQLSLLTALLS